MDAKPRWNNEVGYEARVDLSGLQPQELGAKEAEMQIVGVDLHARQQTICWILSQAEIEEKTLRHVMGVRYF